MNIPWSPVVFVDIVGSALMLLVSFWCAVYARQLTRKKPDDVFRNYLFLFTLAILFFAVSRSFGHLVKQLLLLNDMADAWSHIAPFSGAVNSTAFVVIFALSLSFNRFQKVHQEIEHYRDNLEEMIAVRTKELEESKNTLENILNNTNPINITGIDFDLLQANEAYYALWPRLAGQPAVKCYESRPGAHCHTEACPLRQIVMGSEEVIQEVSKEFGGEVKDFVLTAKPFRDVDGRLLGMVESFHDITLRKQAERAMLESEERFRNIFESSPDPVILSGLRDGAIIDVNKAFAAATGISRDQALGRSIEELGLWLDQSMREPFRELLLNQGALDNYESAFRVADGQVKTGLVSARILKVKNEPCILSVIRDITIEKAAERALVEMDRMKSELISTAAHELSTPLSAILGYAELLRTPKESGSFSEEQRRAFIDEVYDRGEALSRIIDNLLDVSRIESGHPVALDLQETDFGEVLRRVFEFYRLNDREHTFHLELADHPAPAPMLRIDRHRVNQVLENLLSNAVKYSPKGTAITLSGRVVEGGWEVRVVDQGIGMSQQELERIYDKFYRADSSNTAISGLGLGMSIVRQIIGEHHGSIRVESARGAGTTVTFFLPFSGEQG